jgi:imidazolonepropionase-like amidohydrolase
MPPCLGRSLPHRYRYASTEVNARIVGQEGKLGVIKPGATADLIVCRTNPVKDLSVLQGQGEGISLVVKEGRIVKPVAR